jgi:hypothetical protein
MFTPLIKILFVVHLKHASFWPSADVIPVSDDLVHAMPWQCMFSLYKIWVYYDQYGQNRIDRLLLASHFAQK